MSGGKARQTYDAPRQKLAIRHVVVALDLLTFALVLIAGAAGLFYLNRIGRADERLYVVGIDSLGVMAEMREEFNSMPAIIRDLALETDSDRVGAVQGYLNRMKEAVAAKHGQVARMVEGQPDKERLAGVIGDQLDRTWVKVDEFAAAWAGRKQDAMPFVRQQVYPYFQASQKAMGLLQESMKEDAASQVKANRATITSVSVAMAVCTAVMAMLALLYAGRIAKHIV